MTLVSTFSNSDIAGNIYIDGDLFTVRGRSLIPAAQTLRFWAAAPVERRFSLVGSGMPFATEEQAYESTPNQGSFQVSPGSTWEFAIKVPNSYYSCQGNTLVQPHVNVVLEPLRRTYVLQLGPVVPNRSLTSLPGRPNRVICR
jgi:hypothetical protein